jgi:hypothetical protein
VSIEALEALQAVLQSHGHSETRSRKEKIIAIEIKSQWEHLKDVTMDGISHWVRECEMRGPGGFDLHMRTLAHRSHQVGYPVNGEGVENVWPNLS